MKWLEVTPIPEECKNCMEEDCYNCDAAGKRWKCSREDALYGKRMLIVCEIERLQRKVAAIDAELEKCAKSNDF